MQTYVDVFGLQRLPTGLETDTLVGMKGRLSSAVSPGATSLPVTPNTSIDLKKFDQVTIFDGGSSEVVQVGVDTAANASSIPLLTVTQFAHAQYATYCTDGAQGSLADAIVEASAWVDDICERSLFQQSYTGEVLNMPSMSASIDNSGALTFSPHHFPVNSVSKIVIKSSKSDPVEYDTTEAIIDAARTVVRVPSLVIADEGASFSGMPYARNQDLFLTIDYNAGYTAVSMPGVIKKAAILLASVVLARRDNPTGATSVKMGKRAQSWGTGKSGLPSMIEEAEKILNNFKRRV